MTASARELQTAPQAAPGVSTPLAGHVVYMYAFDVAYEMERKPIRELLGQPVAQFAVDASKRNPRQLFFYRPQMVRLPPLEKFGPRGVVRLERTIKLLPVGAISITVRIPFAVNRIDELVPFHDLRFSDGTYLYDHVRDLAEQVRRELHAHYIRPLAQLGDEEAYTVFCISSPIVNDRGEDLRAEDWMHMHRREISALLTEERDPARLSDQESDESSGKYLSYYKDDVVVIDWDAALIVDEPRYFDEILYTMELANLQLAELEAYDRILDDAVERAYRDISAKRFSLMRSSSQRDLLEIRVDLARLSDELSNITKFFGDWHLARIYQAISSRFHLGDWHRTIDEKLKTLDDLYQLLKHDQTNRYMLMLEIAIVLLFILDIIKSVFGAH
ncbi:MAG TPA: hypothetical protein VL282_12395 [Tepidisphaeraceae bacterium]|jgi:hypothetical protein|nr:hypothetical protein [Tepidisphaeraceae bacterium]